jgi:hypothetical protein
LYPWLATRDPDLCWTLANVKTNSGCAKLVASAVHVAPSEQVIGILVRMIGGEHVFSIASLSLSNNRVRSLNLQNICEDDTDLSNENQ